MTSNKRKLLLTPVAKKEKEAAANTARISTSFAQIDAPRKLYDGTLHGGIQFY